MDKIDIRTKIWSGLWFHIIATDDIITLTIEKNSGEAIDKSVFNAGDYDRVAEEVAKLSNSSKMLEIILRTLSENDKAINENQSKT